MEPTNKRPRDQSEQQPRKKLKGWRATEEQPDYEDLLATLTEYFFRHAFEEDNEVEVRLGQFVSKRFNPGISAESFHTIMDRLTSDLEWVERQDYMQQTDYLTKNGLRLRVSEDEDSAVIVNKRNSSIVDVRCNGAPFDFRVSFAKEKPVLFEAGMAERIKGEAVTIRHKDRVSFMYKNFSWDLSVVSEVKADHQEERGTRESFDERPGDDGGAVYEVEIELRAENGKGMPKKCKEMARHLAESMVLKAIDMMYFLEGSLEPRSIAFEVAAGKDRKKS
jgi:hypothetical protein